MKIQDRKQQKNNCIININLIKTVRKVFGAAVLVSGICYMGCVTAGANTNMGFG